MASTELPIQMEESPTNQNTHFSELFTATMVEALSKAQAPTVTFEPAALPIGIKLDGSNYALWSQVVEMYISSKDKLGDINGELTPPSPTDPSFHKWCTNNAIVKCWLINFMDSALIGNFFAFPQPNRFGTLLLPPILMMVIPPRFMISGAVFPIFAKQVVPWKNTTVTTQIN